MMRSFVDAAAVTVATRADELFAHLAGTLDLDDGEVVRDARVASNRLRATLDLYAPCFRRHTLKELRREVKQLVASLGRRYGSDVTLASLTEITAAVAPEDRAGIGAFAQTIRDERIAANEALAAAIDHAHTTELHRRLRALEPWPTPRRAARGAMADCVADAAQRRLDALVGRGEAARATDDAQALRDVRRTAERLRDVLELGEGCFGSFATTAAHRARGLQEILGGIEECDAMLPRVRERFAALERDDVRVLVHRAGNAADLHPSLVGAAPNRGVWRGLVSLSVHLEARRALLHRRWVQEWEDLQLERVPARLRDALAERPTGATAMTPSSHTSDGVAVTSDTDSAR